MSLSVAIAQVQARLTAVASVRNVYSYAREAKDPATFTALFQDKALGKLHTWMITRDATAAKDEDTNTYRRTYSIVMMGYYAVNDAVNSEGAFQQIVEDVCAAFDPLPLRQYGGLFDWSEPVQVEGPTVLMYGPYLCHAVKLVHRIQELNYAD